MLSAARASQRAWEVLTFVHPIPHPQPDSSESMGCWYADAPSSAISSTSTFIWIKTGYLGTISRIRPRAMSFRDLTRPIIR
jgi:hypothetical protein